LFQSLCWFLLPQPIQRPVQPGLLLTVELLDARGQVAFANLQFIPVCMGAMAQCISQVKKASERHIREVTVLDRTLMGFIAAKR